MKNQKSPLLQLMLSLVWFAASLPNAMLSYRYYLSNIASGAQNRSLEVYCIPLARKYCNFQLIWMGQARVVRCHISKNCLKFLCIPLALCFWNFCYISGGPILSCVLLHISKVYDWLILQWTHHARAHTTIART